MTDRDCENCIHYVAQIRGGTSETYYGCNSWNCEFEPTTKPKEEPDEQSESE